MLGKRKTSSAGGRKPPCSARRQPRPCAPKRGRRVAGAAGAGGRWRPSAKAPRSPSAHVPIEARGRGPAGAGRRAASRALGELLRHQDHRLLGADRHHRPVAARPPRHRVGARGNPRHRQRHHRAQEHRDVDRRAGGPARGHLQRRSRLRPARAAARPRRHRRHHGQRRRPRPTSRSAARCSRPPCASATTPSCMNICQRIVSQVGRRVDEVRARSATRACPTAAASTSSRRRWPSTGRRSPSASSRRTS